MIRGNLFALDHQRCGVRLGSLFVAVFATLLAAVAGAQQQSPAAGNKSRQPKTTSQAIKTDPRFAEIESLLQQGAIVEAKRKVQEHLKSNPSSVEAYNLLGIIDTSQKDYANALEAFQQALRLDPKSARTRNNLGNLYVAQEKLDAAEKEFRAALRLDPGSGDAHYNLGLLLMAKGSSVEAIGHFQQVRPLNLATRLNLLRAYLRAGRTTEGLKLATEVSGQNSKDVELHSTLGALLGSEKQYRAAQFEFEKANALQPERFVF